MGSEVLDIAKTAQSAEPGYSDDNSFDLPDEAFSAGVRVVARLMREGTLSEDQAVALLSSLLVPYVETVLVRDVENCLKRALH